MPGTTSSDGSGKERYPLKAIEALFAGALERPGGKARDSWLRRAAGGNEDILSEVAELLAAHETSAGFLERGALLTGPDGEALVPENEAVIDAQIGTELGPYKLVALLGEGGFGTVFRAEQKEPVRREVALKVIKLGMDTRQVIARFEAERQALAMLDHPSIARVLDAGATESGRPYFVMDLASGSDLTEFCDEHRLTIRERLTIFSDLCSAVQHAHQRGIIHRDLKPSNVLVSKVDGGYLPKVIDFGIAKATGEEVAEVTLFTQQGQIIGTPIYMSPEQATGGGAIDTRADVYSLGVILYELLCGATPLSTDDLRASSHELAKFLEDFQAPPPSERFAGLGGLSNGVAKSRSATSADVRSAIRGDLDHIALCALESDRDRRYESAAALRRDIQRSLENRPIEASPPSSVYRASKFVRRHRVSVLAAAAVLVASVAGAAVSINSLRSKKDQGEVLLDVFKAASNTTAADGIDRSVRSIEQGITRAYSADAPILVDALATLADRLGRQGLLPESVEARQRALDAALRIHGDGAAETDLARAALGSQQARLGQRAQALKELRTAVSGDVRRASEEGRSVPGTAAFNAARLELARIAIDNDELDEAERLADAADRIARTDARSDVRLRTEALETLVSVRMRSQNKRGAREAWRSLLILYDDLLPDTSLFVPRKQLEFSRWLNSVGEPGLAAREARAAAKTLGALDDVPPALELQALRALNVAALDAREVLTTKEARASFFRELNLVKRMSGGNSSAYLDALRLTANRLEQVNEVGTALGLRCDRFKLVRAEVAGQSGIFGNTLLRVLADELGSKGEQICRRDGLDGPDYYAALDAIGLALEWTPADPFLLEAQMVLMVRVGQYLQVFGLIDNFRKVTGLKGEHPLLLGLEAIVFSKQTKNEKLAKVRLDRARELAREPQFVGLKRLEETLIWASRVVDGDQGSTLDAASSRRIDR